MLWRIVALQDRASVYGMGVNFAKLPELLKRRAFPRQRKWNRHYHLYRRRAKIFGAIFFWSSSLRLSAHGPPATPGSHS